MQNFLFLKKAKFPKNIDIVQVNDGLLFSELGKNMIQAKTDIQSGTYSASDLVNGFVKPLNENYDIKPTVNKWETACIIDASLLNYAVKFTANDTIRQFTSYVLIDEQNVVGTDAYFMTVKKHGIKDIKQNIHIHRDLIQNLKGQIEIVVSDRGEYTGIKHKDYIIYRKSAIKYPDYLTVIPNQSEYSFEYDPAKIDFKKHIYINKYKIHLISSNGKLIIRSENLDTSIDIEQQIGICQIDFEFKLNPKSLQIAFPEKTTINVFKHILYNKDALICTFI